MPFGLSPSIESARLQGKTVRISVAGARSLTSSRDALGGFELLVDSCWVQASAYLEGLEIVLSLDDMRESPKKLRYLQSNVIPDGVSFLYNEYGLPLAPTMDISILSGE